MQVMNKSEIYGILSGVAEKLACEIHGRKSFNVCWFAPAGMLALMIIYPVRDAVSKARIIAGIEHVSIPIVVDAGMLSDLALEDRRGFFVSDSTDEPLSTRLAMIG